MSGGVDSSVAAMLMLEKGYNCVGGMMILHPNVADSRSVAKEVATKLGMDFFIFELLDEFSSEVIDEFAKEYQNGRTPNPCVVCNRKIKFGAFYDRAAEMGLDCMVTGHYVQVEKQGDRFLLRKGADFSKDQSYVLYSLSQQQLSRSLFPLGRYTKAEVRAIADKAGLINSKKSDSQDICFVPGKNYVEFITMHTGFQVRKGSFIDSEGKYLGESAGVINYTVGQRRGIGLSLPYPGYVLKLDAERNIIVVGKKEQLYSKYLTIKDVNLIAYDKLEKTIRAKVKIRYSHEAQPANIVQTEPDRIQIEFDNPQRAITAGQSAVIYEDDYVLGGGVIN